MIDDSEIDAMEKRCNAATPGPWFHGEARNPNWIYAGGGQYSTTGRQIGEMDGCDDYGADEANARFAAAAREDAPKLIGALREARAEIDQVLSRAVVLREQRDRAVELLRMFIDNGSPRSVQIAKAEAFLRTIDGDGKGEP